MQYLYKNFLKDKRVYNLNEGYYARLFKKLTRWEPKTVFNTRFRNGEKFYDGNPIFSALVDNRVLRIIQEEPESNKIYLSAWLTTATEKELDELVITLELSKEAKPLLEKLITKWVVEKTDKSCMEAYIEKTICNESLAYPPA